MIQIIYTSVAADDIAPGEVYKIIEKSVANNGRDELSGFLLFQNNRFFQVVEGPEAAIDNLLERLGKDRRHHSIEVTHRAPIELRHFGGWKMKRLTPSANAGSLDEIAPELASAPHPIRVALHAFLRPEKPLSSAA